jgi:hypothetical protein
VSTDNRAHADGRYSVQFTSETNDANAEPSRSERVAALLIANAIGGFACTTNAPELPDAAAARRFLFKIRFLPITADQIAEAYHSAFGLDAPAFVLKLGGLDAGRFRNSRKESNRAWRSRSEDPGRMA